jgi:hypothetical protein
LFAAKEAPAQDTVTAPSHGYIYAAPVLTSGGLASAAQLGGGGDTKLYKNLALSGDVGWIATQDGFGLASVNGTYNLPSFRDGKLAPFVTSGYTLGFRDSTASSMNVGGGFTTGSRKGRDYVGKHAATPARTSLALWRASGLLGGKHEEGILRFGALDVGSSAEQIGRSTLRPYGRPPRYSIGFLSN